MSETIGSTENACSGQHKRHTTSLEATILYNKKKLVKTTAAKKEAPNPEMYCGEGSVWIIGNSK